MANMRTLGDFDVAYGGNGYGKLVYEAVMKADNPLLNATTGNYATHYGPKVWVQLNMERNAFGILPKRPYGPENGWRVMTAHPTNKVVGVAEDGTIPDTERPDFVQVYDHPQSMVTTFNSSEIEILTAKRGQAITWKDYVGIMGNEHKKGLNEKILAGAGTPAGLDVETIDRVAAAWDEANSCATDVGGTALAVGDLTIYNVARGAASWADATVLHNSDVARAMTLALWYELERTVAERSGVWDADSQVWLTGYDTFEALSSKLQAQQRFQEAKFKIEAFAGIKTAKGTDGGFRVLSFNGKPVIFSNDVQNKANFLSPVYLLNTKFLELWMNLPTVYQEIGVLNGTELAYGKLGQKGMFKTIFQLICTGFFAQGKLRDLAA